MIRNKKNICIIFLYVLFTIVLAGTAYGSTELPMLAARDSWYPFTVAKSNIQEVEFRDFYTPDGTEVARCAVDERGTGSIMAYLLSGRKKVVVAGNGSGGILANRDCSGMFEGFKSLWVIAGFDKVDTCKMENCESMFLDCNSLREVDLSCLNTTKIREMNAMFQNCNSLETVDIQYWDFSNVKDMSYMFSNCASIDHLTFRLMKKTALEDTTCMFADCYELKDIDLSLFQTDSVKSMQKMFMNCCSLEELDLCTWKTGNVTDFSRLFSGCSNLRTLNLEGWDTGNVKHMDLMFDGCEHLTDLSIRWDTSSLNSAEGLFSGCASMEEPSLDGFVGRSLLNIDGMFAGCTGLVNLDLSGMNLSAVVSSTQSDLFGDTVYSNLQSFEPPLGVRISMPMPETGMGRFMLDGEELTLIPKNLERPVNMAVSYLVIFADSEDETVYARELADWGSIVATPSQPVKESEEYEYTFLGWHLSDGSEYREEPIHSDTEVFAAWEKVKKQTENPGTGEDPNEEGTTSKDKKNRKKKKEEKKTESEPGDSGKSYETGGNSGSGSSGGGSSGGSSGGGGSGISYRSTGTTPSGSKLTVANASATFSSFWKADEKGGWKITKPNGTVITSAWLCDDAVSANGQNVWYLIGSTGEMLSCGLVQDNTGNFYSLETTHNGFYGMLRYRNGFYSCGTETLYITFDHEHHGSFGAITNPEALEALKRLYGVTGFPIGNENCIYTSSF